MNYKVKSYRHTWVCLIIVIGMLFIFLVISDSKKEFSEEQINFYLLNRAEEIETEIKRNITYSDIEISDIIQDNTLTLVVNFMYDRELDAYIHNQFASIVNKGRANGIDQAAKQCLKEVRYELSDYSIQIIIDFKLNNYNFYSIEY